MQTVGEDQLRTLHGAHAPHFDVGAVEGLNAVTVKMRMVNDKDKENRHNPSWGGASGRGLRSKPSKIMVFQFKLTFKLHLKNGNSRNVFSNVFLFNSE